MNHMTNGLHGKGQGSVSSLAEHMATFVIGSGNSFTIEEGLSRLQKMESSGGVWTMKVRIQVTPHCLLIVDDSTGREIERFHLKSLKNVQSVSAGGAYDNLLVFTVTDSQIPEFHIFRCLDRKSNDLAAAIDSGKNGRLSPGLTGDVVRRSPVPLTEFPQSMTNINAVDINRGKEMLRKSVRYPSVPQPENPSQLQDPTDRKVKLLDCLFSDIETFVTQLQRAVEAYNNLRKRKTIRENGSGDGLLSMRSRIPPGKDFKDILQKFKLSFILIEKLKHRISNPNAPELIHFLFKPLGFVVRVIAGSNLEKLELVSSVDNPLINEDVRFMFENCLSSAENQLWKSLGNAWVMTSREWHERLPIYRPVFQDGWCPPLDWMYDIQEGELDHTTRPTTSSLAPNPVSSNAFASQSDFLRHLQTKDLKYAIVKEDRAASNQKELSAQAGECLEILDDSRNWWKVRNYKDEKGYVSKRNLQLPS